MRPMNSKGDVSALPHTGATSLKMLSFNFSPSRREAMGYMWTEDPRLPVKVNADIFEARSKRALRGVTNRRDDCQFQ